MRPEGQGGEAEGWKLQMGEVGRIKAERNGGWKFGNFQVTWKCIMYIYVWQKSSQGKVEVISVSDLSQNKTITWTNTRDKQKRKHAFDDFLDI